MQGELGVAWTVSPTKAETYRPDWLPGVPEAQATARIEPPGAPAREIDLKLETVVFVDHGPVRYSGRLRQVEDMEEGPAPDWRDAYFTKDEKYSGEREYRFVVGTNVIYPAGLRDLLLRLADRYLFSPLWSADIHAEWTSNLLADRPDIDQNVLDRTRAVMDRHFPDALVTGYEVLAAGLDLPDADDRHVLAAAIHGHADVIVTANLRDFPSSRLAPYALVAQHPDAFVADLIQLDPESVLAAVRGHRAALRNPPRSVSQYLSALERLGLSTTSSLLRSRETDI